MKNKKLRQKEKIEEALRNIRAIVRHIKNVQENCIILGEELIELGQIDLGKALIANGLQHDHSKFSGVEFEFMAPVTATPNLKLKIAINHHQKVNAHHTEYWIGGINDMPDVFLAEMVCDLKSRSEEFGTSLMDYIDGDGIKRWKITKESDVYKRMIKFVNLLCEKPFKPTS